MLAPVAVTALESQTWRRRAFVAAAIFAASVAYVLFHSPFEVGDTLNTLLRLDVSSLGDIFRSDMATSGFVRPMTVVTSKVIFETAQHLHVDLFAAYRTFHLACVTIILLGVVASLEVTSFDTCALAVLALAMVIGNDAFRQAVAETELNMKLIMVTSCVGALLLTSRRRRWWTDIAAIVLATYAMFANELGLLVAVILIAGYVVGFRAVSRYGVAVVSALLLLYIYLRFFKLNAGLPELAERSSGFGFSIRSPQELQAIFGANHLPFYAYNIAASAMSVLFAEPSNGVFVLVRGVMDHKATTGMIVATIASTAATIVLVTYVVRRWRAWLALDLTHEDRLFVVAMALIAANAVISFPYLKNVTMVPAATFFAVASFVALKHLVTGIDVRRLPIGSAAAMLVLVAALSAGWALRGFSFYVNMRTQAYKSQADWVSLDDFGRRGQLELQDERQRGFVEHIRQQMIDMPVPHVYRDPRWFQDLFTTP